VSRGPFEAKHNQSLGAAKEAKEWKRKKEIDLFMCQYFAGQNNLENANIINPNEITFLADKKLEEITKNIKMLYVLEVAPTIKNGGKNDWRRASTCDQLWMSCQITTNCSSGNINAGNGDGMLTLEFINLEIKWMD